MIRESRRYVKHPASFVQPLTPRGRVTPAGYLSAVELTLACGLTARECILAGYKVLVYEHILPLFSDHRSSMTNQGYSVVPGQVLAEARFSRE